MTVTPDALDLLAGDPPRYPHVPGDFHRHPETGAPYVAHPTETRKDGTPKRVMYGRPSSFGATLDNPFNLLKWKERQLLIGAHGLEIEMYGFLAHELPDRDALDGLAARCHDAAGSHLAADQGMHIHRLLEFWDRDGITPLQLCEDGEALGISHDLQRRIVDQWRLFRQRHGLTALAVEQTVVNDRWRLAGTLDRLDVADHDILTAYGVLEAGVPFVGDIKTGGLTLGNDGQPDYWIKYPVQLAAYVDSVPYDVEDDERDTWTGRHRGRKPPNPHIALIYHYDLARALAGEVVDWQIIPVNVDAGREGGDLCRQAADFVKRRDLFAMPSPVAPAPECHSEASGAPGDRSTRSTGDTIAAPGLVAPVEQPAAEPATSSGSAAEIDALRARVKDLVAAGHEQAMRRHWPEGVRTLKHDDLTATELAMILGAVRRVEAEVGAPFVPGDVTSRSGAINRARKAWKDSGRDEAELWFAATVLATYEQCRNPECTLDNLIAQFTIEQANRLHEQATTH